MINRRTALAATTGGMLLSGAFVASARAQTNAKLARMIVPFTAGGGTDVSARMLAEKMRAHYPSGLIVENKPAASGRIAAEYVKDSEPDGMTMLFSTDFVMTVYPYSYRKLNYDPLRDFAPVALCGVGSYALAAGPGVPANVKNLEQFVSWCKANPKSASFASTSAGSPSHFIGILLSRATGVALLHVPYKGGAPALQDVMGGQIPVSINPMGEVLPQLAGGKIRVLATTGPKRNRFLPDVPTLLESGVKDGVVEFWGGLFVPAKTPPAVVAKPAEYVDEAFQAQDMKDYYARASREIVHKNPAEFASLIKSDMDRWKALVQASGFTAEE